MTMQQTTKPNVPSPLFLVTVLVVVVIVGTSFDSTSAITIGLVLLILVGLLLQSAPQLDALIRGNISQ